MNSNFLSSETSPYLLQHAQQPVQWYPWNETALKRAQLENKPILLSIGYAACHWCHVMAQESFSDPQIADFMNQHFINIKVDREERPDLDKIYQTAHHLLQGRNGGWPLTVFLTPHDQAAFFAGTYFPVEARYGLVSFGTLLERIVKLYTENFSAIQTQNQHLIKALEAINTSKTKADNVLDTQPLLAGLKSLEEMFDAEFGGFSEAPKFPQCTYLNFLLNSEQNIAHTMAHTTLEHMALGGIYDQLGGGFFRYSVDAQWMIPHFEKMLYDNGQLLSTYVQAYRQQPTPLYQKVIASTAEWLLNEMYDQHSGGFFASLDADSDHEEGKFYYWDLPELELFLTQDEYALIAAHYGINREPNFEGHWHLYVDNSLEEIAKLRDISHSEAEHIRHLAVDKLLQVRQQRTMPARDTKILTAWNALVVKGLLQANSVLNNKDYGRVAQRCLNFIYEKLWQENQLYACYSQHQARFPAYLDDYAFLMDALFEALIVEWQDEYLSFLMQLAERLIKDFYDAKNGGFFFTAQDHESLLYRPKTFMDEALPAGNSIAILALYRLGHLIGRADYLTIAHKSMQALWPALSKLPHAHASALISLQALLASPTLIILRGETRHITAWQEACLQLNKPQLGCFAIPNTAKNLPSYLQQFTSTEAVTAYCCAGTQCLAPISDKIKFINYLRGN